MAFFALLIPVLVKAAAVIASLLTVKTALKTTAVVAIVTTTALIVANNEHGSGQLPIPPLLPFTLHPPAPGPTKVSDRVSTIESTTSELLTTPTTEKPDDECPANEEDHRATNRQIIDVRDISARIWNSRRRNINVQYNDPGSNRLFQVGFVDIELRNLFQYYNKCTGQQDPCHDLFYIDACQRDQTAFIEAISNENGENGPMYVLYQWLVREELFRGGYRAFKDELKRIWFTPYNRSIRSKNILDSSGFEHVFLGEITRKGRRLCVSGFHNWMRMWKEEDAGNFKLATDAQYWDNKNIVASVQFQWHNSSSKWSSFFMETSPATEIALYTLCFMTQPDNDCNIELDNTPLQLRTHTVTNRAGLIGSAYPFYSYTHLIAIH